MGALANDVRTLGLDNDQQAYLDTCLGHGLRAGALIRDAAIAWNEGYSVTLAAVERVAIIDGLSIEDAARVVARRGGEV